MPISKKYKAKFIPSFSYHIYNRTNGNEKLFHSDMDRTVFLQMMKTYLFPFFEVNCYCLLGNHFHILASTKTFCEVLSYIKKIPIERMTKTEQHFMKRPIEEKIIYIHTLYRFQFNRLFLAYCKYFNRTYNRKGNLFNRGFKRIRIDHDLYFQKLVLYIHQNPIKHGISEKFEDYQWSSFKEYYGEKRFISNSFKILELFHGIENFSIAHTKSKDYKLISKLLLE